MRSGKHGRSGGLALVTTLCASACVWPNPAFDPQGATGSGPGTGSGVATSSTAGATGSTGVAGTEPTGGSVSQGTTEMTASSGMVSASSSGAGATGTTTDPPACGAEGEACGEGCCDPCLTCTAGLCVSSCPRCNACTPGGCAAAPQTPCNLEPGERCEEQIFGVTQAGCVAYAAVTGVCDGAGVCTATCKDPGELIDGGACDPSCSTGDTCVSGEPIESFNAGLFCILNAKTPACGDNCFNTANGSSVQHQICSLGGICVFAAPDDSCGNYVCHPTEEKCLTTCAGNDDCAEGFLCVGTACVP